MQCQASSMARTQSTMEAPAFIASCTARYSLLYFLSSAQASYTASRCTCATSLKVPTSTYGNLRDAAKSRCTHRHILLLLCRKLVLAPHQDALQVDQVCCLTCHLQNPPALCIAAFCAPNCLYEQQVRYLLVLGSLSGSARQRHN